MRILITGASGLVGQGVLRECLRAADVDKVAALGRHPTGIQHRKLEDLICGDFAHLGALHDRLAPFDACFYCAGAPPFGTSAADYRNVTVTLTMNVAEVFAQRNEEAKFFYISGAHSNPRSRIMILRVKGEVERALAALPITTVMVRPGGIQPVDGVRSPHRLLDMFYRFAGPAMGLARQLLPGQLTTTANVGRALIALARDDEPPQVVENAEINRRAR